MSDGLRWCMNRSAPAPGCPICDRPGHNSPGCGIHPLPLADLYLPSHDARVIFDSACRVVAASLPPLPGERRHPPAWYVGGHRHGQARGWRYVNQHHWSAVRVYLERWRIQVEPPVLLERAA